MGIAQIKPGIELLCRKGLGLRLVRVIGIALGIWRGYFTNFENIAAVVYGTKIYYQR